MSLACLAIVSGNHWDCPGLMKSTEETDQPIDVEHFAGVPQVSPSPTADTLWVITDLLSAVGVHGHCCAAAFSMDVVAVAQRPPLKTESAALRHQ